MESVHTRSVSGDQFAVSMKNVSVRYGELVALKDITLHVPYRTIVSIVGPNGGGKTTLLNTLLGFVKPYRGSVRVLGQPPKQIQNSGRIGYLPQMMDVNQNFPLRVWDVVAMSRYCRKKILERLNHRDKELIRQALERVDMFSLKATPFHSLSMGQKQRVLIARALARLPDILILDEPSTGLDAVAQDSFYKLLETLRSEFQITVLIVSHDIGSVSAVVDQIACLNRMIHFHGKPGERIPSPVLERVFGKDVRFLIHDERCETCKGNR
jgi:zinc transport system ATP-binding protein